MGHEEVVEMRSDGEIVKLPCIVQTKYTTGARDCQCDRRDENGALFSSLTLQTGQVVFSPIVCASTRNSKGPANSPGLTIHIFLTSAPFSATTGISWYRSSPPTAICRNILRSAVSEHRTAQHGVLLPALHPSCEDRLRCRPHLCRTLLFKQQLLRLHKRSCLHSAEVHPTRQSLSIEDRLVVSRVLFPILQHGHLLAQCIEDCQRYL